MKKLLIAGFLTAFSTQTMAIDITFTEDACTLGAATCASVKSAVENKIKSDTPDVPLDKYATGSAKSLSIAGSTLASDYSDEFSLFSAKFQFGPGIGSDMSGLSSPEKAEGLAVQGVVTLGLNMDILPIDKVGPIELEDLDLFVSLMDYNLDLDLSDVGLNGKISSLSLMGRYKLIDSISLIPGNMVKWGGLYLHTGFQMHTMKLDSTISFAGTSVSSSGQTLTFDKNSKTIMSFKSNTTFIPIEVSTHMRLFYALTLYGGAGVNVQLNGKTKVDLKANGTAATADGTTYKGTISGNGSESGKDDSFQPKAFAGFQINIPFVRLFTQVNTRLGAKATSFQFGLKALF